MLTLTALGALSAGLAGCSRLGAHLGSKPSGSLPTRTQPVVARAIRAARQGQANALALAPGHRGQATLLRHLAALHAAHLTALGATPTPSPSSSDPSSPPDPTGVPASTVSSGAATTSPGPGTADSVTGTPDPAGTGASPPASPTPNAAVPPVTPSRAVADEWNNARTALRDAQTAPAALAVLLCRIAAARAANADLLARAFGRPTPGTLTPAADRAGSGASAAGPAVGAPTARTSPAATTGNGTPPSAPATGSAVITSSVPIPSTTATGAPTPTPTTDPAATTDPAVTTNLAVAPTSTATPSPAAPDTPALNSLERLLAGQHAAVYVYPLIVARAATDQRDLARTLWQAHRDERDLLAAWLVANGTDPVEAQPGYDVGTPPTTGARTVALATRVEQALAALAADVIADATGPIRLLGADELTRAARAGTAWTATPTPFPGLTPTATPTATPTPTITAG